MTFLRPLLIAAVLFAGTPEPLPAQDQASGRARVSRRAPRRAVRGSHPLLRRIIVWQYGLRQRVSGYLRQLKTGMQTRIFLALLGLAVAYGMLHALGPGHGKIIVGSCVIRERHRTRSLLQAAAVFSAVHNGGALLLYTVFLAAVGMLSRRMSHDITAVMRTVSGVLLVVLGAVLLAAPVIKRYIRINLPERVTAHSLLLACAAAGLVPCPGSLALLFFAGSQGLTWLGYVLVLGFAVGMFITLSLTAILLASGRTLVFRPFKKEIVFRIAGVCGALFLTGAGLYLLFGQ